MARTGRPPKVAETVHRGAGSDRGSGATSHRPKAEIVTVAGRNVPTSPPDDLPSEARDLWIEIVRVLAEAGIIDTIDLPMLRQLTVQYARARQATAIIEAPLTDGEDAELVNDIRNMETIEGALTTNVANQLRAGLAPQPAQINALANYSTALLNKRAYLEARRKVGGLVAIGSTGQLVEHPMVGTERAAASLLLRFAGEYAMTPVARTRLGIAVLEGRSLQKELEEDLGTRRRDATAKKPGSGRKPRKALAT